MMSIEQKIGELLIKKNLTLSIAESCTGGLLSHMITNVPKSSAYFDSSVLCYSKNVKVKLLGIPEKLINKYGTVSAETAKAMADAVRKLRRTKIGLAVTGIAGPDSIEKKPVGTVYIAVSYRNKIYAEGFRFKGNRKEIKTKAASQKGNKNKGSICRYEAFMETHKPR
ncbi:MAG: CinA family protein [Nitrospirae bacterium]|nr:CinA family protein [Nitrospirota bacterium]